VRKETKVHKERKARKVLKGRLDCRVFKVFKEPKEIKAQQGRKANKVSKVSRVFKVLQVLRVLLGRKAIWVQLDCKDQLVCPEKHRIREPRVFRDLQESKESKECLELRH
jgi:hypothetical protein